MNCNTLRGMEPKIRLAYLVTHPIQYQAPLLRRIAAEQGGLVLNRVSHQVCQAYFRLHAP